MNTSMNKTLIAAACVAAAVAAGCASAPSPQDLDKLTLDIMKASFRDEGIAKVDRLNQDLGQKACSSDKPPAESVARQIEAEALATIQWPAGGQYLGDWREGEKLAQNGRGMTWTDKSAAPAANGGNCYNCHQISKQEISYGTIGPTLAQYGRLRGVTDPASPQSRAIVEYTWAKIWNPRSTNACSDMPRFGHAGVLDEQQIKHLMALLLDPKSPVNK
mgnify:CR=1 FL=1